MRVEADELRDLNEEELMEKLKSAKTELFNLRFQMATGQLDNPTSIKDVRRSIARIQTIVKEKEIAAKRTAAS